MNELTPVAQSTDIQTSEPGALLSTIMRLAMAPDLRIDVLTLLLDRQERMEAQQAERAFNAAMNAAQSEIQPVVRTAENTQTRSFYAKLEHVDAAIRPIYLKHGFSLSYNQIEPMVAGNIRMACRCAHSAGHSEMYYREAPADTLGPKGAPTKTILHGGASTETFLKRYLSCGIFNVVFRNQDDDGVRGGMKFISSGQADEIREMLRVAGREEVSFLGRLFAGAIHSADEIEQGAGYMATKSTLDGIIRQNAARRESSNA